MTRGDLTLIFTEMFPAIKIHQTWVKGKAAIRLRPADKSPDLVFTYFTKDNWKVETLKMWENSVDGI